VVGELDDDLDQQLNLSQIRAAPLKAVQALSRRPQTAQRAAPGTAQRACFPMNENDLAARGVALPPSQPPHLCVQLDPITDVDCLLSQSVVRLRSCALW